MFARLGTIGVLIALSSVMLAAVGPASADEATPSTVAQLFVQTARDGTLRPVKGEQDVFTLTLRGLAPRVTSFTDRPLRAASPLGVEEFLQNWDGGSFETDPPNAALVIDDAPQSRDTFVVELTAPDYDAKRDVLRYTATLIRDEPDGRLVGFAEHVDEGPPTKFGRSSLFIDSLPSARLLVTISGEPAGKHDGFALGGGFLESTRSTIDQGDIQSIFHATNGAEVITQPTQQGTATVELEYSFCVSPSTTSLPLRFAGPPDGTTIDFLFFASGDVQTFTSSGTLTIPADYQLAGCPE